MRLMTTLSWLMRGARWVRWFRRRRRSPYRHRPLMLEVLEDRLAPTVHLWSGTLPTGTTHWLNDDVNRLTGTVTVPVGATLIVDPGAIVKVDTFFGNSLIVNGTLI